MGKTSFSQSHFLTRSPFFTMRRDASRKTFSTPIPRCLAIASLLFNDSFHGIIKRQWNFFRD